MRGIRQDLNDGIKRGNKYTISREYDMKLMSNCIHTLQLEPIQLTELMKLCERVRLIVTVDFAAIISPIWFSI